MYGEFGIFSAPLVGVGALVDLDGGRQTENDTTTIIEHDGVFPHAGDAARELYRCAWQTVSALASIEVTPSPMVMMLKTMP